MEGEVSSTNGEKESIFSLLSSQNRNYLISSSGNLINVKDIEEKTIGLYFGANWYAKCEKFTQLLASTYSKLNAKSHNFEIIFISFDENQTSFDKFHATMPWPALPFYDLQSRKKLTQKFQIEAIPSLIILSPHSSLICYNGVELVYKYGYKAFPFSKEAIKKLEDEEKEKYECPTLEKVMNVENLIKHDEYRGHVNLYMEMAYPYKKEETGVDSGGIKENDYHEKRV